jgi:hypothetical protein
VILGIFSQQGTSRSGGFPGPPGTEPVYPEPPPPDPDAGFIIRIDTTKTGATSSTQFRLPLVAATEYDFNVDWGDSSDDDIQGNGSTIPIAEYTHTYSSGGVYDIEITGVCPVFAFRNIGDRAKLLKVLNWGGIEFTSCFGMFYGCVNLDEVPAEPAVTQNCESFENMYRDTTLLNQQDIETETRSGTTFASMFRNTPARPSLSYQMDTRNGQRFNDMFRENDNSEYPWFDTGQGFTFAGMFQDSEVITTPAYDLEQAQTTAFMFFGSALEVINPGFDMRSINTANGMFGRTAIASVPSFNWAALANASSMFSECLSLVSIADQQMPNCNNFVSWCRDCSSLVSVGVVDVFNAFQIDPAFFGCTSLETLLWQNILGGNPSQGYAFGQGIGLANCSLSRTAIVTIFGNLRQRPPDMLLAPVINVSGNPGTGDLTSTDIEIATNKGWVVTT